MNMPKKFKSFLAIVLLLAMVLPMLPLNAFAASTFDVSQWNTTGWNQTTEYGHTVLTADSSTDNASLYYTGSMDRVNSVEAEIRYNTSRWPEASGGFYLTTGSGVNWFIDYRADANAVRIRRNGEYITYCTLNFTPKATQWVHWEVCWDDTTLYVLVKGEVILSCNYAGYGDVFDSSTVFRFYEWGQPMSVRAVKVNQSVLALWDAGTYQVTTEDGVTVLTGNTNANEQITYRGNMAGVNGVEVDIRYNATETAEASGGIILYTESGVEWYVDYKANGNAVRIRRNGGWEFAQVIGLEQPAADEWMHWDLSWDGVHLIFYINGTLIAKVNYAQYGDTFGANSSAMKFNHWLQPMSVKNITLRGLLWAGENWGPAAEDGTTVYTASAPETGSDANASAVLDYYGSLKGINTIALDMRYNVSKWEEASSGLMLYTNEGTQWWVDYRADVNAVRIRRNGDYLTYTSLTNAPAADAWSHWVLSWDDTNIYIAIDGETILTQNYADYGDVFDESASFAIHHWGQPASVKNMKMSKREKEPVWTDDWTGAWTAGMEGQDPVLQSASGGPLATTYTGSIKDFNSFEAYIRTDSTIDADGNVGMLLRGVDSQGNPVEYFISYRGFDRMIRVGETTLGYLDYDLEVGTYYRWQLLWGDGVITLKIENQEVASTTYDPNAVSFTADGATVGFSEWKRMSTVKNVKLSYTEQKPDTSDWTLGDWSAAYEGDDVVFTGDPQSSDGSGHPLIYLGSLNGYNTVKFGMRYNQTRWGEANAGLAIYDKNGNEWYIDYRADVNAVRVRRNGNFITYPNLPFTPQADEWMDWEVTWSDTTIFIKVNGEVAAEANYAAYGDDLSEGATMRFNEWGQPVSIKNVTLSNQVLNGWVPNGSWIKDQESGEDVYSAQLPQFDDSIWPTLSYVGSFEGINSISYKYRYNKTWFAEAWGGLILVDGSGNEWNIDYRADANAVRMRRNGNYVSTAPLGFEPKADEWMDFQVIWSDTTIYLKVNGTIVLEAKYASFGDAFNKDTSVRFMCWGQPVSVKNMVMETVKPSAWNFVDLEFTSPYSVESFEIVGGNAVHQNGQMIVDITAGGLSLQSPRIEVPAGSRYSAFLPVRNTLVVRMKNDTAADHITLYFVSTLHQEYGEQCSKTFEIKPYSDYTTYFFNLSDVIHMGSAAKPFKYTSQVMDSEGYLRGFKLVLPETVTEGTIALDAVTFEREDPLYDYAGEIISTVADSETKMITVTGKVDASMAGKEVIIYESAVNNYNEDMSYPINTEHTTVMVDIAELVRATVQADGTFEAKIPLYAEDEISRLSSLFLAWIDGVKVSGHFSVDNYQDFHKMDRFEVPDLVVNVTDPQFGAKGDAFTDDTKAIQAAIDYVASQGGGVVVLPGDTSTWHGRRYIATNINLKSNIELRIEEGAMIWQSQREEEYDYSNNYFTDKPIYGHDNDREGVVWAHSINDNLPLLYVGGEYDRATGTWGKAITNVRITGGGTVRMLDVGGEQPDPHNYAWNSNICVGCANRIHIAPVVFWHADNCDLVNITIQRTNSWHVTSSAVNNMYFANNTLEQAACINSDSFGCGNSKNMTIFRNFVYGNDDGVTLSAIAEEKRAHVFYFVDPDRDNSTENINIISNQIWNGLGIAFIPWGSGGEDASRYLTKNILIYDNVLGGESCAIGSWPDNPTYGWSSYYTYSLDNGEKDDWSAIQDVTIINNRLMKPYNVRLVEITNLVIENTAYKGDQIGYYQSRAATRFLHGNFDKVIRSTEEVNGFKDESNWVVGLTNWSSAVGKNGSVGTEKVREDLKYSGYIKGDGELWQGIYLMLGAQELNLKVHAISGTSTIFVADHNGNVVAELPVANNADFEEITFTFTVPASGTYRLGVKHQGAADEVVYLDDASVVRSEINNETPENSVTVTYPFEDEAEMNDFNLFQSAGEGFTMKDGKLVATGTEGEFKAVLNDFDHKYSSVSVEIHPGEFGINAGLYIGAEGGADAVDAINGLGILIESNFTGWNDAANRVDLVVGNFPNWNELGRYTSETGYGNNLFTDGVKEPLLLKVDMNGNIVTVTLSLVSNPATFIQTVFEYTGRYDLHHGTVGMRALSSDVSFDNLTLVYTKPEEDAVISDESFLPEDGVAEDGTVTETIRFDEGDDSRFNFYHSSNGGFMVKDGALVPTGEPGEFKAVLSGTEKVNYVGVTIHPGEKGINGGIYLNVSNPDHPQDKINALAVLVQSDFEGWDDAANRVDMIVGIFPTWSELFRLVSETGANNNLFIGGKKEPLRLEVSVENNILTMRLSLVSHPDVFVSATYEYTGVGDLTLGDVGLRSQHCDAVYDNLTVKYLPSEDTEPDDDKPEQKPTDVVDFENATDSDKFDFYHSSNGGFAIVDGKLVPTGEEGEFKAIYKDEDAKFSSVSVDIYPGEKGINGGIYLNVSTVDHGVDKIKALAILVESNFSGWDDAVNRIDLVVGSFPIWKELSRYTSETGANNALFSGEKEPVNLKVELDGNKLTITLSLLRDPKVYVTTTYEYTGEGDISLGNVGLRSAFNDASFDNFSVTYVSDSVPDTGDHNGVVAALAAMLMSAACAAVVIRKKEEE